MSTLAEIEAAVEKLPLEQQNALLETLGTIIARQLFVEDPNSSHSVLEIPPVDLGQVLQPLTSSDDLLGEMLEGRTI